MKAINFYYLIYFNQLIIIDLINSFYLFHFFLILKYSYLIATDPLIFLQLLTFHVIIKAVWCTCKYIGDIGMISTSKYRKVIVEVMMSIVYSMSAHMKNASYLLKVEWQRLPIPCVPWITRIHSVNMIQATTRWIIISGFQTWEIIMQIMWQILTRQCYDNGQNPQLASYQFNVRCKILQILGGIRSINIHLIVLNFGMRFFSIACLISTRY